VSDRTQRNATKTEHQSTVFAFVESRCLIKTNAFYKLAQSVMPIRMAVSRDWGDLSCDMIGYIWMCVYRYRAESIIYLRCFARIFAAWKMYEKCLSAKRNRILFTIFLFKLQNVNVTLITIYVLGAYADNDENRLQII